MSPRLKNAELSEFAQLADVGYIELSRHLVWNVTKASIEMLVITIIIVIAKKAKYLIVLRSIILAVC